MTVQKNMKHKEGYEQSEDVGTDIKLKNRRMELDFNDTTKKEKPSKMDTIETEVEEEKLERESIEQEEIKQILSKQNSHRSVKKRKIMNEDIEPKDSF